jgi:hypothetical protein
MHSIEAALTRDFVRRGATGIPAVLSGMIALPLCLYQFVGRDTFKPTSKEGVALHVSLTLAMGFFAAFAVIQAQGNLVRFFVRPISAARLVGCQLGLGMATMALMYLCAASLLNVGGAGWPLLGPALFLAVALACTLAAIWSFEGNVLGQLLGCVATSTLLVIWFSSCYGATDIGQCNVMWYNPTAGEALMLIGTSGAAYLLATVGVTRARRGDVWDFAAPLRVWWDRLRTRGSAVPSLNGPMAALLWSAWRENQGPAPACLVGVAMLAALGTWAADYMPTEKMLEMMVAIPIMLMLVVLPLVFGLLAGNCGNEGKWEMKQMLATRPVTDVSIAQALLRNCAIALLSTWGTWFVGLAIAAGLALLSGHREDVVRTLIPAHFDRSTVVLPVVLFLLASWTVSALMASLAATGRPWLWLTVLLGIFGLGLTFALLKGVVYPSIFERLSTAWLVISGGFYLGGTTWAFVVAFRRGLISTGTVLLAAALWLVLTTITIFAWPENLASSGFWLWNCVGFLALGILPFATMPLAIQWNRHR